MESEENKKIQTLADAENAVGAARVEVRKTKDRLKAEKGRYHTRLIARRESGETLTVGDMKALEATAIDDVPEIKAAYLAHIAAMTDYEIKNAKCQELTRIYWDNKPGR